VKFGTLKADRRFVRWWHRNDGIDIPGRWTGPLRRAAADGLVARSDRENCWALTEEGRQVFDELRRQLPQTQGAP